MREDEDSARALLRNLQDNGLAAWMDKESTPGGELWWQAFTDELSTSRYCISVFSSHYREADQRVFSQELDLAIQELRRDTTFSLIPVRLEPCALPNHSLGQGVALSDLHWTDLFGAHAEEQLLALLAHLGAKRPRIHFGPIPEVRVRRLDLYPFSTAVTVDGRELCSVKAGEEVVVTIAPGNVSFYARVYSVAHERMSQASYDVYDYGRSETLPAQLKPFGKYLLSIDASKVHHETFTILSALWFFGKVALHRLGVLSELGEAEESWTPTIQLRFDRIYFP